MAAASEPLVSVVVATYNMGRYLANAVESLLAQTYPHVEVIVVDDGSTDETPAIVERLLARDPRVRHHRKENGGQASAKNKGIELSRGDFIGFLDADDEWRPGKLALQLPLFAARPRVGVVYSEYECMDGEGRPLPKQPTPMQRGTISGALLIDNFISFPTALVRRECLERFGVFDAHLGMGIDYDLWLRLSPHYDFDFIDEPTIRYRMWSGQMSKNYRRRYESGIRIMSRFLEANPHSVPKAVVDEAWAHTFVGRGDSTLWNERDRLAAFKDYFRALRHRPAYWPAWRSMMRSIITTKQPT